MEQHIHEEKEGAALDTVIKITEHKSTAKQPRVKKERSASQIQRDKDRMALVRAARKNKTE